VFCPPRADDIDVQFVKTIGGLRIDVGGTPDRAERCHGSGAVAAHHGLRSDPVDRVRVHSKRAALD
jgi:hypothetical protein